MENVAMENESTPREGSTSADKSTDVVRVTLVTAPGCHLCDDARLVVARVCEELSVRWHEMSIRGNPRLADRYGDLVPVVLVDGAEHAAWRVDATALSRVLTEGVAP